MKTCTHGNGTNQAHIELLRDLPQSQAGPGEERHKCAICAYSIGYREGYETARRELNQGN